ncbi:MAG: hypothetical protein ACJ780_16570, partial [Solirubrobacteraceae bacterium]
GRRLPAGDCSVIHDLACGTGAMGRWLAPRLPGPQHWVLHDRDAHLLEVAGSDVPGSAADGSVVAVECKQSDITRLTPEELGGAAVITASALLDLLTEVELTRLVGVCSDAGCPALLTLSVVGHVVLSPADPMDPRVGAAFDAHQRRTTAGGRLLGPDALAAAAEQFRKRGAEVLVAASPWRLGSAEAALMTEWFTAWVYAACEQDGDLRAEIGDYPERRLAQSRAGRLAVTVDHTDLLALPQEG